MWGIFVAVILLWCMFKSLDPKLTLKKSHAEFRSLKNFQKGLNNGALNYHVTPCHFVVILIADFTLTD